MEPIEIISKSVRFVIYDQYIVAEPKSGVDVFKPEVEQLSEVVSKYFQGNFGLIEDRKNRNSINPLAYPYAKELMPNFTAFALVAHSDIAEKNFESERYFMEGIKHKIFPTLEEAKEWMKSVL